MVPDGTWTIVRSLMFDSVSSGCQITQFLWQNFEFRVGAIDLSANMQFETF